MRFLLHAKRVSSQAAALHTVQFFAKSCDISYMRLKLHTVAHVCSGLIAAHFGRLDRPQNPTNLFQTYQNFNPITDATKTSQYNMQKILSSLLNHKRQRNTLLVKSISNNLFSNSHPFVFFDVV